MKSTFPVWCAGLLAAGGLNVSATDFANSRQAELWLRHPVYGDPSFDSFERVPGNPIHRGAPPFEWPVNGFLFHDPVSRNEYIFVGDYAEGYGARPSRCLLYRSTDGRHSWTNLGVVVQGDTNLFDKGGHTPDASVVYDAGRYHMLYDWGELNFNEEGGLAYAWAERPEGPWHRAPEPITRNTKLSKMLGRYQRTYAGTLIRRQHDWLIAAMMDAAPNSWALFVMTAPTPAGPWSERQLVRCVESDTFHPPLMEFFPAFAHDGFLYAPATSVALNRNFNALFRAPLERAADPQAWQVYRHGSLWHGEPFENEHYGIWGQTISGSVDEHGTLWAMFNSRDARGFGTVNLARRPWKQPLRKQGFVLSGHQGPSFTCLRRTFRDFDLDASLLLHGTASIIWDWLGAVGPNHPQSDAKLHALTRTRYQALELSPSGWAIVRADDKGEIQRLDAGSMPQAGPWRIRLRHQANGESQLSVGGRQLWSGRVPATPGEDRVGAIGLWVEPKSHLAVDRFALTGRAVSARIPYLGLEGLLGAGENPAQWEERRSPEFRFGLGLVSKQPQARVKWNMVGRRLILWSPSGPDYGKVEVRLDGHTVTMLDQHSDQPITSRPVWTSPQLSGLQHALVCRSTEGLLAVDSLEVEN